MSLKRPAVMLCTTSGTVPRFPFTSVACPRVSQPSMSASCVVFANLTAFAFGYCLKVPSGSVNPSRSGLMILMRNVYVPFGLGKSILDTKDRLLSELSSTTWPFETILGRTVLKFQVDDVPRETTLVPSK